MTIARRGERWALTRTDDVCEAGGVEEFIAAKWVAEETIWVVRNFVAEGESENTYNPRMCPWVGKVVDYDEDEDCATPYHIWYVDDGDEEWLSAEEVYNHRISAERATLLRGAVSASKDSGKCSVTSADLKMRATLSTRAGYDPTHSAVTHKDEGNKYHGTAGIVIKVEGTKKGRTITVRWADGVERPYTTKQLEVVGSRVNTDWDLRSIVSEGTITTSASKIKLMVYIGGIPYSLVGAGSGKYEAAPFVREEEGAPSFFEERKKKKKRRCRYRRTPPTLIPLSCCKALRKVKSSGSTQRLTVRQRAVASEMALQKPLALVGTLQSVTVNLTTSLHPHSVI